MISSSLHPEPVRAACQPRGRFAFGLTPRTIWLLAAGLLLALPGFFRRATWGYGMLALGCAGAARGGSRRLALAAPRNRSRSSAPGATRPSLDSETEIELAVEHSAETILECHLVDDLPDALVAAPATHCLRAFPRVRATLRYKIEPRERGDVAGRSGLYSLCFAARAGGALGHGAARADGARLSGAAPGRGSGDLSRARTPDRSAACARRASADWAATSRACANISKATICATSAGRRQRAAAS